MHGVTYMWSLKTNKPKLKLITSVVPSGGVAYLGGGELDEGGPRPKLPVMRWLSPGDLPSTAVAIVSMAS